MLSREERRKLSLEESRRRSKQLQQESSIAEWELQRLRTSVETAGEQSNEVTRRQQRWKASSVEIALRHSFASNSRKPRKVAKKKATLRGDECPTWTKEEVKLWLKSLGLEDISPIVEENEINGELLLEIGLDDLDYMGIKALGHRKTLLKEISRLRNCLGINQGQVKPTPAVALKEAKTVMLDEVAEHEAFRRAVEEWRRGFQDQKPETSEISVETKEQDAFKEAVNRWRSSVGGCDKLKFVDLKTHEAEVRAERNRKTQKMLEMFEQNLKKNLPYAELESKKVEPFLNFDDAF